jgi:hypothetical protein
MNAAFCVAWRPDGNQRDRNWRFVLDRLAALDWPLFVGSREVDGEFSRAASRNDAAYEACHKVGPEVLVFHDADMIAPAGAYLEAAAVAVHEQRLVVGFTDYRALGVQATKQLLNPRLRLDPFSLTPVQTLTAFSVGGIVAVPRTLWVDIGGYDERFVGWGCEDFAFAQACGLFTGLPTYRTSNVGVHLWHPHGSYQHPSKHDHNARLLAATNAASTRDEYHEMRADPDYRWRK